MVKGDSVELGVTVNVPGGRQCELVNRAATIFPVAGTRYNNVIGDDLAAATASIPAKSCEKPERPQCEPGTNELRSSSGACVCKTGLHPRQLAGLRPYHRRAAALPRRHPGAAQRPLPQHHAEMRAGSWRVPQR